ncbi:efflux RND transporter permease subunit [Hymenobacter swuensis]|uniref:Hydrophobe/amphiphile efflux-1 (HAE1) family transporter n=1 Tax=Hymenobacter swuensis DY53 TaxID=1227739 RepID=W8F0J3_9BACT|nr:efflux RND transporter permease subunit [Hymenobacter swuensis]AHJ95385.1 hydrophobe/amphiphile efflux-1 (HAE1) family transporter [Hymenobacter swuensis DY53]
MFKVFIERPVLSTVISILLVILGALALWKLPLQQFPDIAPPAVQVTAVYPGANAETLLRSVAPSLEEAINGVEHMVYMSSTASNDGSLVISVNFQLGTDPDQAAVNVQNRVAQATSQLPAEVVQQGVTVAKQQNSFVMLLNLYSEDPKQYDQTFLDNYAQINLVPELKRIPGVGSTALFGGNRAYSMRVWLNPTQLASYHLTPGEVMAAIQDKNLEAAPGRLGESSQEAFEYVIKYKGKRNQPLDYENMVLRANADGSMLRLKDVARVELGSTTYNSHVRISGKPGINIGIFQSAGSNANELQIAVGKAMQKLEKDLPQGVKQQTMYSTKVALDASIEQVEHTLIEAFVLVFLVVFLFLQDFRSTLIPAIAVPVAIVGTFFFMQLVGFSINLLTLFALVLAIGIVVDDAIVVVEAVHSKLEEGTYSVKEATSSAMSEITGAIISITLVMAAVFLPVGFLEGSTGVFYRQFAFTMAIAIIISAVNALTLSPALAALFLKHTPHNAEHATPSTFKTRFFAGFNRSFERLTSRYVGSIKFLVRHKWVGLSGLVLVAVLTGWLAKRTPSGFIPAEDQGFIVMSMALPAGSSLDRSNQVALQIEQQLEGMPAVDKINLLSGFSILTSSSSSSALTLFVILKPTEKRGAVKDINAIMAAMREKAATIKGADTFVFTTPTVPGFGNVEGLEVVLQDRTGGPLPKLSQMGQEFIGELMKQPAIGVAFTSFRADYPQLEAEVDEVKAAQLGVSVKAVLQTMQAYFGSAQASDFNRFGKYYRVLVQAEQANRADPTALSGAFVKNDRGEMVPLRTLVRLKRVYGPETASRFNLFNSLTINAVPKPGYSSGDAIKAVEAAAAAHLPSGYSYEFSGLTREEISSGGQSTVVFLMCLVFVYFLLAAQYESYILPFAVLLSLPAGMVGVFAAIGLAGITNNIYVQVALIMLIGLLAKNAILIVEFALQRRQAGEPLVQAALNASASRLRPILMTSLAFVVGMLPMMRAQGPSALGNHSISIAAAGGMLTGVVLGLFFIPLLFVIFQRLNERLSGTPHPAPAMPARVPAHATAS